jgi:pimeloyl-ACP methyl ester carboxylesterase
MALTCEVRMRDRMVERWFGWFTSADRAEAIAGDLAEERDRRGTAWFWRQAAGVTLALWGRAAADAPLRTLAATIALTIGPLFAGTAAANLFPPLSDSPLRWLMAPLVWWALALSAALVAAVAGRRRMPASATLALVGVAVVITALFVVPRYAFPQPIEWTDPSPHTVTFVPVDSGVQLEVLDWGGAGPALVLLAGLGDTAHVFDDFAPMLTARHRVLAVTRRGHGRSAAPATGYGFARLAEDVARVIEATGVEKPIVIGHSFAGEELHVLGARYAGRIAGVVYIDAAFNRGDDSDNGAYDAAARALPAAPGPEPRDKASFLALRSFLEQTQRTKFPEAHLRARYLANPDGTVGRMWAPDLPIRQEMSKAMQAAHGAYQPERIHAPALAIYAVPKSAADRMRPWYPADDPTLRARVETLYGLERARVANHIKWFEAFAARGRVAEISGAHHLFVSNPREVIQQIDAFSSALAARR